MPAAREVLYVHGFQYPRTQGAFLLPASYGRAGQALRIQAVAQQLAAHGIGVGLRHSAPPVADPWLNARSALLDMAPVAHRR
ncbi:hypothetical protein ABZ726_33295 [Streptomyces hundungensis]|uniref:hypothetical protein n=1 Tax=Streptomyces hundungensis TaxID=1077946 RepID=UPI0033C2D244